MECGEPLRDDEEQRQQNPFSQDGEGPSKCFAPPENNNNFYHGGMEEEETADARNSWGFMGGGGGCGGDVGSLPGAGDLQRPPVAQEGESSDASGGVSGDGGCDAAGPSTQQEGSTHGSMEEVDARVSSSTTEEDECEQSQQQQQQQQPAFVNMALKQWSIYLGNMLLNYIQRECRNGQSCGSGQCQQQQSEDGQQQQPQQQYQSCAQSCNGGAADDSGNQFAFPGSDSTTVTPTRFCPCCHYHNHMAAQQQQQQQQQQHHDMMQTQQQQPSLIGHPLQQHPAMSQQQAMQAPQQHQQPTFHPGYYNYAAANFSSYFAAQRARVNGYVQGKDPSVDFTQDIVEESEDERCFDDMMNGDAVPPIELPPCEVGRLEEISELVSSCLPSPMRREKLAVAVENEGYVKKLLNVFRMCEDLEDSDGLHHLYEIFKNVFLLNKNALFELMFAEDTIFDVVGCLENDPAQPRPKRHREYLRSIANFHQVIKINNPELLSKIHQTYRVQYIQDVVLPTPSVFEENMLSTLSSFIFFNKVEIVTLIQEDEKFLTELFAQLTDSKTDDHTRNESVRFLKEFCTFSQTLQPQSRESFFKTLNNLGVLHALEITLATENKETKSASVEILNFIVEFSPSMIREYMLQQLSNTEDDSLLMNVIIEQMIADADPEMGGAVQLMGIIRILLDPENMLASVNKSEKTDFLNYFYKHCMHVFIAPLLANTSDDGAPDGSSGMDSCTVQLLSLILELLSFCVEHHTYHIKNYILHKDLLRRILVLMKSRHTFLVLCALRFMRKIIALKDEFYNRYIIKGNLFAPVVDALVTNNGRYNLLDSAILEMFEFIKMEDIKSLCTHVVENFGPTLDKITYVQTFKALKLRYDQHQDRLRERPTSQLEGVGSILRPGRFRRDPREMDEDEEMWFNEDDYESSPPNNSGANSGANSNGNPANNDPPAMTVGATAATLSQQQQQQQQVTSSVVAKVQQQQMQQQQQQLGARQTNGGGASKDEEDEEEDGMNAEASAADDERPRSAGSSDSGGDASAKKGLVDYEEDSDDEEMEEDAASSTSPAPATTPPPASSAAAAATNGKAADSPSSSSATTTNGAAAEDEAKEAEADSSGEPAKASAAPTEDSAANAGSKGDVADTTEGEEGPAAKRPRTE